MFFNPWSFCASPLDCFSSDRPFILFCFLKWILHFYTTPAEAIGTNLNCFHVNGRWGIDSLDAILGPLFEKGRKNLLHLKVCIICFSLVLIDFSVRNRNWREHHWFHHHILLNLLQSTLLFYYLFFIQVLWDNPKDKKTETMVHTQKSLPRRYCPLVEMWQILWQSWNRIYYFFIFIFCPFRAEPVAQGASQARGWIGAVAVSLATATATPDLGHICSLHRSSRQHRILSPLREARDRTCILMDACWVR